MASALTKRLSSEPKESQAGRFLPVTSSISVLALLCLLVLPAAEILQFDRAAIDEGQVWRLLSGHVTHWSVNHLTWDLCTFAGLGLLCESLCKKQYCTMLCLCSVCISLAVYFLIPEMIYYRGLSGLCVGQFAFLAAFFLKEGREKRDKALELIALVALIGLALKIGYEFVFGTAVFVDVDQGAYVVVPLSHLVGALFGVIFGGLSSGILLLQSKEVPVCT